MIALLKKIILKRMPCAPIMANYLFYFVLVLAYYFEFSITGNALKILRYFRTVLQQLPAVDA